ncbi:hypothetical protein [Streptomyces antimycoticus]
MTAVVDRYGKVTVSLAGRCPLACRHCYTTAKQFEHSASSSVSAVLSELEGISSRFEIICISGDTDCFLDPDTGFELISRAAERFPAADIMFTSRLIPDDSIVAGLGALAANMVTRERLLIPGISLVSMSVPNFSERSRRVPSTESRLELMAEFSRSGMACLLALRPTFPFSLVPPEEVRALIRAAVGKVSAVLGEILLLDSDGELAGRLGLDEAEPQDRLGRLTFLDQPSLWKKRTLEPEVELAARACRDHHVPYFLRSGEAHRYIRAHWDWRTGSVANNAPLPSGPLISSPDP